MGGNGNIREPLVTVITLIYNTGSEVLKSLDSLLSQDYKNIEHIIVDDCSPDNLSVQLVENWIMVNNHHCTFIKNDENIGICKSFNKALKVAHGEYWAPLCDDFWHPGHLSGSIKIFEGYHDKKVGFIYSALNIKDIKNEQVDTWTPEKRLNQYNYPQKEIIEIFPDDRSIIEISGDKFYNSLFYCNIFHPVSAIHKMSVTKDVNYFDESLPFEDWDYAFKVSKKYDILYNRAISSNYIIHGNNFTKKIVMLNFGKIKTLLKYRPKNSGHLKKIRRQNILDYSEQIIDFYKSMGNKKLVVQNILKLTWLYPANIRWLIKIFT